MATTYKKILSADASRSASHNLGRHWSREVWEVTADGTVTTLSIPTAFTKVFSVNVMLAESGAIAAAFTTQTTGDVVKTKQNDGSYTGVLTVVLSSGVVTTKKVLVYLEGYIGNI